MLILVDDYAHDAVGHSGRYPFLETPHIDRLAKQGTRFRNAFVTTALCAPSRASILTGCYASRHNLVRNISHMEPGFQFGELPTLPDVLHDNGYETAFIGKWHIGSGAPFRAFDYWAALQLQGNYDINRLNVNGQEVLETEYVTDFLTRYALQWIEDASDSPFFLMLSHKAVHGPFRPAPRHAERFASAFQPMPVSYLDDLSDKHPYTRFRALSKGRRFRERGELLVNAPIPPAVEPEPWDARDRDRLNYFRCILAVDESVGRVLDVLDQTGRADDTLVLLTSDQGFFLGEHQLFGKDLMYEAALRVPLLVRAPAPVGPPRVVDELVLNIDLAPTLLDLCGCPIPSSMQGASFAALLGGNEILRSWRDGFFYEHEGKQQRPTISGLRTASWKLITYPGEDFEELYDLENDPDELHNLARDASSARIIVTLRAQLAELRDAARRPWPGVDG